MGLLINLNAPHKKRSRITKRGASVLRENGILDVRKALDSALSLTIRGIEADVFVLEASHPCKSNSHLPVVHVGRRYPICVWPAKDFAQDQVVEAYREYLENIDDKGWIVASESLGESPEQIMPKHLTQSDSHYPLSYFERDWGSQAKNLLLTCLCLWVTPSVFRKGGTDPVIPAVICLERYNGETPIKHWSGLMNNLHGATVLDNFPQLEVPFPNTSSPKTRARSVKPSTK